MLFKDLGNRFAKFSILVIVFALIFKSIETSGNSTNNKTCSKHCNIATFMEFLNNQITDRKETSKMPHERNGRILEKPPSATKLFGDLFSKRIFNTTMNFIVPGAKVNLPHNTQEGSLIHLAMQAFFGLFWAVAWLSTIVVPASLTHFQPFGLGRSLESYEDGFKLKWKLHGRLAEDLIGLNKTLCLQKTICQAHQAKDLKYGALGEIIRVLFPVPNDISSRSVFFDPAIHGAKGRGCGIYKCFFDVLDLIFYIKDHCFATFPT